MSEHWNFYPREQNGETGSVFYDHGIRESINSLPTGLLKIRVALKQPRPDGLPTSEEFEWLNNLEDDLQNVFAHYHATFVGRVSIAGHRYFYVYTHEGDAVWPVRIGAVSARQGYELRYVIKHDPEHQGYWRDLYPTADDWQVIKDLSVMEQLRQTGDNHDIVRQIDHYAYFPHAQAAAAFARWASQAGYNVVDTSPQDNGQHLCYFTHQGTVRLRDITTHTVPLRRQAEQHGGQYDGWGTPVCK